MSNLIEMFLIKNYYFLPFLSTGTPFTSNKTLKITGKMRRGTRNHMTGGDMSEAGDTLLGAFIRIRLNGNLQYRERWEKIQLK